MSLNAVVYCDCVEKGRLRTPHPRPELLFIDERGAPDISSNDPRDIEAHDRWESLGPCQHRQFWLIERWLGDISLIGSIRDLISHLSSDPAQEYPVLWSKVIYDGSHSGDFVPSNAVPQLSDEVDRLKRIEKHQVDKTALLELLRKLEELVQASGSVHKPISF